MMSDENTWILCLPLDSFVFIYVPTYIILPSMQNLILLIPVTKKKMILYDLLA